MTPRDRGLQRGSAAGAAAVKADLPRQIRNTFAQWRVLYPTMKEDLGAAIIACDAQRLACEPDYTKFPELRGHADLLRAEREAFRETSGLGDLETAYQFSQWY